MESKESLYHRHLIIGITTFIEILGLTSYALRLLARRLSSTQFWYDDYVMGIGWVRHQWELANLHGRLSLTVLSQITASIPGICYYVGRFERRGANKQWPYQQV